jgi:hypothetical protein
MQTLRRSDFPTYIVIAIASIGMIIVGQVIGRVGLSFQLLIILGMSLTILVTITTAKGVERGFLIWIMMFGLGYRTIHITNELVIHPLTIQITLLSIIVFLKRQTANAEFGRTKFISVSYVPLLIFWIWGWLNGLVHGIRWDTMAQVSQNMIIWIPIMYVIEYILRDNRNWRPIIITFYVVGILVSILGALEYIVPEFQNLIPINGYILNERLVFDTAIDNFRRAIFAFWGASLAGYIPALSLSFGIVIVSNAKLSGTKIFVLLGAGISLFGIYICGYRSLWATVLVAAIFIVLYFGSRGIAVGLILFLALLIILPQTAQDRIMTLTDALQGNAVDSSAVNRIERIDTTVKTAIESPFGLGWAAGGWAHNDFIQVFVDLGVIPGLLYIFWYIGTFIKGYLILRKLRDNLLLSILSSFIVVGGFILAQGPYHLAQLMIPVWFVWSLLNIRIEQLSNPQQAALVYRGT